MKKVTLVLAVASLGVCAAQAAVYTYTDAGVGNDVDTNENWSKDGVPTADALDGDYLKPDADTVNFTTGTADVNHWFRAQSGSTGATVINVSGGGELNVNADHFALVYDGANVSSTLNVGVGGTVTSTGTLYMNDEAGTNLTSIVNITGGTMSVARILVNDDPAAGTASAQFNLLSGTVNTGGFVLDWFGRNDSTVNVTGGSLTGTGALQFGSGGASGTEANLFHLGGGVVQFEGLEFNSPNSKLVFTDGELRINGANLDEAGMNALIGNRIDVSGASGYAVSTDGAYTVLTAVPEPSSAALLSLGGLVLVLRRSK